jgi:DNA helicase-2/ATP-dependent DNA helicase PcrA
MLNEAARGSNIRLGMNPTASQLEAIHAPHGHLQLIACAGSGKTEVVARRVVELLRPQGGCALEPRNVLAFTFTERAAAELKERITTRVRESLGEVAGLAEMFVGTIHGFCLDLLRREAPVFLGYNVLDEVAQRMLIERHPERSGFRAARLVTGDELVPWRDTGVYIKALDVLRQGDVDPARLHGVTAAEGLRAWRELLEDRRCLDYTAILEHAVRLLTEDAGVGARIRARVRHVIVDEYQDVNPIQERVVRALAGLGAWLCVVGDDDQSIYQWNGASVTNILRFAERYPDVRTVRLQENFRSSRAIVELARVHRAEPRASPQGDGLYRRATDRGGRHPRARVSNSTRGGCVGGRALRGAARYAVSRRLKEPRARVE